MQLALGTPSSPLIDGSTSWDAVAQSALAAWNPYMGANTFSGVSGSSAPKAQGNGINNVFFSSTVYGSAFGGSTLAITVSYASGNRRVEGDVLFNTAFVWNSYRGPTRFVGLKSVPDLYRVALHEFGHVLGLDHPDQAGQNVPAIMNSTISDLDNLAADDIAGAMSLYLPGGISAPTISSHPSSQTVMVGASVQFSVTATGTAPLTYQWYRNGNPISGATASTLNLISVSASDAGTYKVMVTNSAGSVTSNNATLTVNALTTPPQIITHPQSQTAMAGSSVTLAVTVSGTAPFVFQWKRDNQSVAIQSTPDLILTGLTSANAGSYTVTVSNAAGSVTSNAAVLTVIPAQIAPAIVSPPLSRAVALGAGVSFYVVATGSPAPAFQWRHNGIAIPGATSSTFSIASVALPDAGVYTVVATNIAGSVTSQPAFLTISEPPVILSGPSSLTITAGQSATFSVSASGPPPLAYQWMKNGNEISGATSGTLSIGVAGVNDSGAYTVRVSNSAGSIVSSPAVLTVNPASFAPLIQSQPQSATVPSGGSVTFSVGATGLPAPSYQWSKDGTQIPGAASATLVLSNVTPASAGSYAVRVSNSLGSVVSVAAVLTVTTPPSITTQPASQTVTAGRNVSLSVVATGTAPLSYQWKKGAALITGATGSTLSFNPVALEDAGTFTVTVQNALGSVTSLPATLVVVPPLAPPVILTQPASQTAISGNAVTFHVAASGLPAPTYQWYNGPVLIPGATSPDFTMASVDIGSAGYYRVVATNSQGSATSENAYLTVIAPPRIIQSPANQTATIGSGISFEVIASGTAPLAYQWFKGGSPIPGATQSTLALPAVSAGDAGDYQVRVGNSVGSALSAAARLSVTPAPTPPHIIVQPAGQTVAPGATVTLQVVAGGTGPLNYQWYRDNSAIPNATAATLELTDVQANTAGSYSVLVSSGAGSEMSDTATVSVLPPSQLVNLSVRAQAGSGESALTVGFVIRGSSGKSLLIRGVGPSLTAFGVPGAIPDPQLSLFKEGGVPAGSNNDWGSQPGMTDAFKNVGAFLLPAGSKDSAIASVLGAGAYTAQLTSADTNTGVALVEVYDSNPSTQGAQIVNLSVRNFVGTQENTLLAGIVITGTTPKKLLIRGVGPTLREFGVAGVLEDPRLEVIKAGAVVAENDNWGGSSELKAAFSGVGAFSLPPASADSAMVATLPPGTYSVRLSGAGGTTGVAILEVYDMP